MHRAIRYVASHCRPLPSLLKLCRWGQKCRRRRGHIGLFKIIIFAEYDHIAYQIKGNEAYKTC